MTADPVKDWALYWYEKLQIEAWLRPITPHAHTVPKVCPGRGSDTDLDTLSARRKQKDRREAVFLFVLEDQAQHGEKVGDHVAVHEFVAGRCCRKEPSGRKVLWKKSQQPDHSCCSEKCP